MRGNSRHGNKDLCYSAVPARLATGDDSASPSLSSESSSYASGEESEGEHTVSQVRGAVEGTLISGEEDSMQKAARSVLSFLLPLAFVLLGACAGLGPPEAPQWSVVPIEDFEAVAGRWEGTMITAPRSRDDQWVRVSIGRDGTYEFASYRQIGVFQGRGTFTLKDGRVTTTTERGTATCTLYTADGRRLLRAAGVAKTGVEYSADLTPAK